MWNGSRSLSSFLVILSLCLTVLHVTPSRCSAETVTDSLVRRLKSLRNTDPGLKKREEWRNLVVDFEKARKEVDGTDSVKLGFYNGVLHEELGTRGGNNGELESGYQLFVKSGENQNRSPYIDDALYRAIVLGRQLGKSESELSRLIQRLKRDFPESEFIFAVQDLESKRGVTTPKVLDLKRAESGVRPLIVLDPGHGGDDEGAEGKGGIFEKDVALSIARDAKRLLIKSGCCRVALTREADSFIPLFERTAFANEKNADLFVSIHVNSARNTKARGFEVYYVSKEANPEALELAQRENKGSGFSGGAIDDFIGELFKRGAEEVSAPFAKELYQEMKLVLKSEMEDFHGRGVKKAPFFVLFGAEMPAVLLELFFLSNPEEAYLLSLPSFREKVANALAKGVERQVSTGSFDR